MFKREKKELYRAFSIFLGKGLRFFALSHNQLVVDGLLAIVGGCR